MSDNQVVVEMEEEKKEINLSSKNLSEIPIDLIKKCKALQILRINKNEIKVIHQGTFKGLHQLTGIDLSNNELCTLPNSAFKDCTSLRILYLHNNEISAMPQDSFKGLHQLTTILLLNNKLCSIPAGVFKDCTSLQILRLENNGINAIHQRTFDGLHKLTTINLSNNKLRTIPDNAFKDCTSLVGLGLDNNEISAIPEKTYKGLDHLTHLYLNDNKVCTIPDGAFKDCTSLRELRLNNNEISAIPEKTFDGLRKLTEIYLNNNKLCTLPLGAFKGLHQLTTINLSNNKLCTIPDGAFKDCTSLQTLALNNNEISAIPEETFDGLRKLTEIYLNNNKLCTLPLGAFNGLHQLIYIGLNNNKLCTIPDGAFKDCISLKLLSLINNEISTIPKGTFIGLNQLTTIALNNNKLCIISAGAFKDCISLQILGLNNNEISTMPQDSFKGLHQLIQIDLNNNKLCTFPAGAYNYYKALQRLDLNNNKLRTIPDGAFKGCSSLKELRLDNNEISAIPEETFKDLDQVTHIYLGNNKLCTLPEGTFDGLHQLTLIHLQNNKLCTIPDSAFKDCISLVGLCLDNNEINAIPQGTFDGLNKLRVIWLKNNKLSTLSDNLFKDCQALENIYLSFNRIKEIKTNLFTNCSRVTTLNLDNNLISSISFAALEPLENCRSLDFSNNFLFNPRILYSSFLRKYSFNDNGNIKDIDTIKLSNWEESRYFILRHENYDFIEKHFLLFYLFNTSRVSSIFKDEENKLSLKSKFEKLKNNSPKFSLLDLFIWIFGEIDDSKIIHLKDHIDQLTRTDPQLKNKELLIRSEHSIKHLCTRNVYSHFKSFFPNTYFELTSILQKTKVKSRNFKAKEEDYLKDILRYMLEADRLDKEVDTKEYRSIFFDIDYQECFNIAVDNKNCDIAKFVILLLRYFFLRRQKSPEMKDALNKFNQNLLLKFDDIFKYELYDIVRFLLDIRKLDKLKKNKKEINDDKQFLVYDTAQFNAKQTIKSKYFIKDTKNKKEFLELIQASDDLLKHESSELILQDKWREKRFFTYYFQLFWSLIFVVFYTIYIEVQDQPGVETDIQNATKYISLSFVIVNILVEIIQIVQSRSSRQKFSNYMSRATNWIEWNTFVLCIPAIVLSPGDWKSSLCSITICLSYVILMTRMDKTGLGGYVKVIGKIARDSLKPLVVIVILLLGFLMAFRNRAQHKGSEETSSFETMGLFNSSFEHSFALVYTMMVGNLQTENMGLTNLTWPNLVNFFMFLAFLFIISTLALNIFTGIAIDEIKSLIADSNIQIMKDKINYIYESSVFDEIPCFKRMFKVLKRVFRVEDLATSVKESCLEIICAKSNKVDDVETTVSQERKWQEAYKDDRYSENFETLEDRSKNIENKIDRILNLKEEIKGNQVSGSVSILPINDNSRSNGGFKELFEMMKKISQKQELMDRKMNSQKESIAKQIKESIDEQNRGMIELSNQMQSHKESIDEQNRGINELAKKMDKIKSKLKTPKAGKSSEVQT